MTIRSTMRHEVQYRNCHPRYKLIADVQVPSEKLICNRAGSSPHILRGAAEREGKSIFRVNIWDESDNLCDYRNLGNSKSWTAWGLDPPKLTK
jgi:hypothetical protein